MSLRSRSSGLLVFLGAILLVAIATTAAAPRANADPGFASHGITVAWSSNAPGDTNTYRLSWGEATDQYGAATGYLVKVSILTRPVVGFPRVVAVPGLADTVQIPTPSLGVVDTALAVVWAIRRGKQSTDSVWAVFPVQRRDAAPPPPGPITVDTLLALGDTIPGRLDLYGRTLSLRTGDTTTFCAVATSKILGVRYLGKPSAVVVGTGQDSIQIQRTRPNPWNSCRDILAAYGVTVFDTTYWGVATWSVGTSAGPAPSGFGPEPTSRQRVGPDALRRA